MEQKERVVKNLKLLETARDLRRKMTQQERKLWYGYLKDYPVKIYKQRIIESFVVDFYCASARLVIELDGDVHTLQEKQYRDNARTERLQAYELEVLRFTNAEVERHFSAVCQKIHQKIEERVKEN